MRPFKTNFKAEKKVHLAHDEGDYIFLLVSLFLPLVCSYQSWLQLRRRQDYYLCYRPVNETNALMLRPLEV